MAYSFNKFEDFLSESLGELQLVRNARKDGEEVLRYDKVLKHIDRHSKGALDYRGLNKELAEGGEFYILTEVDPEYLIIQDEARVESEVVDDDIRDEIKIPIVVGKDGFVIDGRHRAVSAKLSNKKLQAYVPIVDYHKLK